MKNTNNKSMGNFSSGEDENKSVSYAMAGAGMGGDLGEQSQSNLLDTTASSLNNTLTGGGLMTGDKFFRILIFSN